MKTSQCINSKGAADNLLEIGKDKCFCLAKGQIEQCEGCTNCEEMFNSLLMVWSFT